MFTDRCQNKDVRIIVHTLSVLLVFTVIVLVAFTTSSHPPWITSVVSGPKVNVPVPM